MFNFQFDTFFDLLTYNCYYLCVFTFIYVFITPLNILVVFYEYLISLENAGKKEV